MGGGGGGWRVGQFAQLHGNKKKAFSFQPLTEIKGILGKKIFEKKGQLVKGVLKSPVSAFYDTCRHV